MLMVIFLMLPVDFKKMPCCPVKLRVKGPCMGRGEGSVRDVGSKGDWGHLHAFKLTLRYPYPIKVSCWMNET